MNNYNRCSRSQVFFAAVVLLSIVTSANAALVSRLNGQAVYDTDLNVTWLANANHAATNSFGVGGTNWTQPGMMNWYTAQSWIAAMNADGGSGYLGFNDWRLPTAEYPINSFPCSGYNCTDSEMGHLYYSELGGVGYPTTLASSGDPDLALFSNIQNDWYWTSTPTSTKYVVFEFNYGGSSKAFPDGTQPAFAWAVRTGDVAVVPIPATIWLFVSGLVVLLGFIRKHGISK